MISRREALELVKNCCKYSHLLLASKLMKILAEKLGEYNLEWELVGLLHDLDFDEVRSDMSKHGVTAAERLKDELPEHCLYAIKAHDYRTGFKPKSRLDYALIAVDSLTVLMEEAQEEFKEPDIQDLKDKLEELSVEEPWHRSNIQKCKEFGLSVDECFKLALIT
jgi:hypothetical protein